MSNNFRPILVGAIPFPEQSAFDISDPGRRNQARILYVITALHDYIIDLESKKRPSFLMNLLERNSQPTLGEAMLDLVRLEGGTRNLYGIPDEDLYVWLRKNTANPRVESMDIKCFRLTEKNLKLK